MRHTILAVQLLCTALAFAGENTPAPRGPSRVGPRILGGQDAPESDFPTVALIGDTTGFFCSGTLIAPNVVLSAGHCAADDSGKPNIAAGSGRVKLGGTVYMASRIVVHPTYGGFQAEQENQFDASLWFLESPVPGVTPSPIYRTKPAVGTVLTLAGFGELGTGATGGTGQYPAAGRIQWGTTPLETVTTTFLKWTFEAGEADTAPGDSGGPAFITVGGVRQVAGITSGGSQDGFGDLAFDTRVDSIAAWIDQQTNSGALALVSGPVALPSPAKPGQSVAFSAAANASDVTWSWNFGDGSPANAAGPSVTHAYAAEGTFTVTVSATSAGTGATAMGSLSIQIANNAVPGPGPGDSTSVTAPKRKFMLNFRTERSSNLDLTLQSSDFRYPDKDAYLAAVDGQTVKVSLDMTEIDSVAMEGLKGAGEFGDGKIQWNFKKGQVRYRLKGPAVNEFLLPFGASNDEFEDRSVNLPFYILLGTQRWGGTFSFLYTARQDKTGRGKKPKYER